MAQSWHTAAGMSGRMEKGGGAEIGAFVKPITYSVKRRTLHGSEARGASEAWGRPQNT